MDAVHWSVFCLQEDKSGDSELAGLLVHQTRNVAFEMITYDLAWRTVCGPLPVEKERCEVGNSSLSQEDKSGDLELELS